MPGRGLVVPTRKVPGWHQPYLRTNAHFVRERYTQDLEAERDARLVARKAFRRTRHEASGAKALCGARRLGACLVSKNLAK
jgi:Lon protease-like protein